MRTGAASPRRSARSLPGLAEVAAIARRVVAENDGVEPACLVVESPYGQSSGARLLIGRRGIGVGHQMLVGGTL
jgi:hypothetical protein